MRFYQAEEEEEEEDRDTRGHEHEEEEEEEDRNTRGQEHGGLYTALPLLVKTRLQKGSLEVVQIYSSQSLTCTIASHDRRSYVWRWFSLTSNLSSSLANKCIDAANTLVASSSS